MKTGTTRSAVAETLCPVILVIGMAACKSSTEPTPTCTLTIAPASQAFSSAGGESTVTVTASASSCAWTANSNAPWATIVGTAAGTGSGTLNYRVAENTSTAARAAALTVGNQTHAITQQGRSGTACTYAIAPSSAAIDDSGGSGSFAVTAPEGCTWTARSGATWVQVTGGAEGTGNGTVSYRVMENNESASRSTTIAVADQTFRITQSREPAVCEYSVAPVEFAPCMPAGTLSAQVTTRADCTWTAASSVPWLTITNGRSGRGSGQVTFTFTANYDAPRSGVVMVRWSAPTQGQNVRVNQAGCRYAVSQASFAFAAAGGSAAFNVVQQSDPTECGGATQDRCIWTATSSVPWITIAGSMPRAGDDTVNFTVAPNGTGAARAGAITVRDKTIQVTQGG